jgi:(4S)-4-hydroxy-5-phosphonooxypentane-2,3-dione isomerase
MIVTCVTVYVKKEHIQDFIQATLENHRNSIKEEGNLRFDVLQCSNDETRFLLYEAYESEEASALHKKTQHYLTWRDTVAPWMEKPREGVAHSVIAPLEKDLWK